MTLQRPRWHHDWKQPPEAPHFCEECRLMYARIEALEAALGAVDNALQEQHDSTGLVWNMLEARDQARAALEVR